MSNSRPTTTLHNNVPSKRRHLHQHNLPRPSSFPNTLPRSPPLLRPRRRTNSLHNNLQRHPHNRNRFHTTHMRPRRVLSSPSISQWPSHRSPRRQRPGILDMDECNDEEREDISGILGAYYWYENCSRVYLRCQQWQNELSCSEHNGSGMFFEEWQPSLFH